MGKTVKARTSSAAPKEAAPAAGAPPAQAERAENLADSRDLLRVMLEAQETERRRVARELHDSVSQLLASAQFRLQAMEEGLSRLDDHAWREALKSKFLVEKAMHEVRRISHGLRPSELDDLGLAPALRTLCKEFSERTGISVTVSLPSPLPKSAAETELHLYRILQEALANVEKHAKARTVKLDAAIRRNWLEVSLRDDGQGFSSNGPGVSSGMGLVHIKERAALAGGRCSVSSSTGKGTKLVAKVPLLPIPGAA